MSNWLNIKFEFLMKQYDHTLNTSVKWMTSLTYMTYPLLTPLLVKFSPAFRDQVVCFLLLHLHKSLGQDEDDMASDNFETVFLIT